MKMKISAVLLFALGFGESNAQDTIQTQLDVITNEINSLKKEDRTHFMLRGFTQFGLDATHDDVNFNMTSFNPVLLWRQGDRFLFESELEMEFVNNDLDIHLGFANASYIVSKGLVVRVGKFLIPFGTFGEKLHPSWVNKFNTTPLGVGHDGIVPSADIGVEIRGGLQLGTSKLNYSLYGVNGPGIKDGTEEPAEAGMLSFVNETDNNNNKAFGSRIGFLPFANSSLEIGVSAYYALPGSAKSPFEGDTLIQHLNYKDVTALLTAFDLSYVKIITPLKSILDFKGQFSTSTISKAAYYNPEDTSIYTFDNNSMAYYIQLAFRPALLDNKVVKNLELVGRYSVYNTPEGSLWENKQSQIAVGLNYWLTWRTVIKASYQTTTTIGKEVEGGGHGGGHGGITGNVFSLHFAVGL